MKKEKSIASSAPETSVVAKQLGRPANPNSKRQAKLVAREAAKEAGTFKKGRPSVAGSKRQAVLTARAEKIAAGIEIKRGRPKVEKVVETVASDLVTLEQGEAVDKKTKSKKK